MAKGVYIGVNQTGTTAISSTTLTPSNIANYCTVTNRSNYYFTHASDGTFTSNIAGQGGKYARTILDFEKLYELGWERDVPFTLSYTWSVSSEEDYDIFEVYDPDGDYLVEASGTKSGSGTYTIYPGTRIYLRYEKDDSYDEGSDWGKIKFTLSGGKTTPSGDRARRVVGMYIGVNGVARRIKRAYIGVNGIARCFWSAPGIYKVTSTVTALTPKDSFMSGTIGNYAIYAGGSRNVTINDFPGYYEGNNVEYYNSSLTKSTGTSLTIQTAHGAGAANNSYFFVGAGLQTYRTQESNDETITYPTTMNKYNTSMTRSTATAVSGAHRHPCNGSTANGSYAIIAGGVSQTAVDYYNTSGTRSTGTALPEVKRDVWGATVGNYCIFAGGENSSGGATASAVAYNNSMTRSVPTALSAGRSDIAAATAGNYAVFYCGDLANGYCTSQVDAYNTSLTKVTVSNASITRYGCSAASPGKQVAVFFCGRADDQSVPMHLVEAYDASLTKYYLSQTTYGRQGYIVGSAGCNCAAMAGNYIILAGGYEVGTESSLLYTRATHAEAYQYVP